MLIEIYPGVWRDITPRDFDFGEIPFLQVFPSGEGRARGVKRPADIFAKAIRFAAHNGQFLCTIVIKPNNAEVEAHLVARLMPSEKAVNLAKLLGTDPPAPTLAAEERAPFDSPELLEAVDRLVIAAADRLDELQ